MWSKVKALLDKKMNVWVVLLVIALLVGGEIVREHVSQDHQSLHTMVQFFNNCLAKPECKALFVASPPPALPGK